MRFSIKIFIGLWIVVSSVYFYLIAQSIRYKVLEREYVFDTWTQRIINP